MSAVDPRTAGNSAFVLRDVVELSIGHDNPLADEIS